MLANAVPVSISSVDKRDVRHGAAGRAYLTTNARGHLVLTSDGPGAAVLATNARGHLVAHTPDTSPSARILRASPTRVTF
jgi:hypothetical protein